MRPSYNALSCTVLPVRGGLTTNDRAYRNEKSVDPLCNRMHVHSCSFCPVRGARSFDSEGVARTRLSPGGTLRNRSDPQFLRFIPFRTKLSRCPYPRAPGPTRLGPFLGGLANILYASQPQPNAFRASRVCHSSFIIHKPGTIERLPSTTAGGSFDNGLRRRRPQCPRPGRRRRNRPQRSSSSVRCYCRLCKQ